MMKYLHNALIFILLVPIAAAAPVVNPDGGSGCTRQSDYCQGTKYNASLLDEYICGDKRLGPVTLPRTVPLGFLVDIYDRFGGTCPGEFLETWYDPDGGWDGKGDWKWPPNSGFSIDTEGQEMSANLTLPPGTLMDRFGYETGAFLSPAGAPFMQRSIPPDRLNIGGDASYPYLYHVYSVVQNITVEAGPISPVFGQPGQGVQYYLGDGVSVQKLLDSNIIQRVDPTVLLG